MSMAMGSIVIGMNRKGSLSHLLVKRVLATGACSSEACACHWSVSGRP